MGKGNQVRLGETISGTVCCATNNHSRACRLSKSYA